MTSTSLARAVGVAAISFAAALGSFPAMADQGHGALATGGPAKASAASRTVDVTMHDTYYEPETIRVTPGETVRFVVRNEGALVHEFNLGTPAMHADHQAEMQMMVEHGVLEPDRINHDMMNMDMGGGHTMKHDDPNTVLVEPGGTAEVVWTFPEDTAADIEFACNVPGHYDAGMVGGIELAR